MEKVFIPYDKESGKHRGYGFVEFIHKESVPYSINLMNNICLLDRYITVRRVTQRRTPSLSGSAATTPVSAGGSGKLVDGDNPFFSPSKPITRLELVPPKSDHEANTSTPSHSLMVCQTTLSVESTTPVQSLPLTPAVPSLLLSQCTPPVLLTTPPPIQSTPPSLFSFNPLGIPPPSQAQSSSLNQSPMSLAFPPNPFFHDPRCVPPPPPQSAPPPLFLPPPPQPLFPPKTNGFPQTLPSHPADAPSPCPSEDFESRMDFEAYEVNGPRLEQRDIVNSNDGLHQRRLHANDHPAWLRRETKEKLSFYHLNTLQNHYNR